ncbi:outer mitochondrial membrane isoform [Scheffersomyces coipomensis]|uniref:outer mitochondrial membrane isoform n=1 Tax=Scheffersomyces coipomensis TaxID=1788519 RepID=UPI00315DD826
MITGVINTEKFRPPQFYSLEQVNHHNSPEDLWMIIYNKIYDITEFAQHHPGGVEVLFDCGGIDATEAFDDVSHSDDAFKMLAPYFIGDLIPQEQKIYKHNHNRIIKDSPTVIYPKDTKIEKVIITTVNTTSNLKIKRKKKKNSSNSSNNKVEKLTILILVILVIFSLALYIGVQKLKWSYHFHSS